MDKNVYFIFTETNAISLTNPERVPRGAICNPDVSHLKGVKREHWKFVDGKIVEMTPSEKRKRNALIARIGASSKIEHRPSFLEKYWTYIALGIAAVVIVWLATKGN